MTSSQAISAIIATRTTWRGRGAGACPWANAYFYVSQEIVMRAMSLSVCSPHSLRHVGKLPHERVIDISLETAWISCHRVEQMTDAATPGRASDDHGEVAKTRDRALGPKLLQKTEGAMLGRLRMRTSEKFAAIHASSRKIQYETQPLRPRLRQPEPRRSLRLVA